MNKTITEVTPLSDRDFFYLVDRTKDSFTFPIHRHDEFELNFVEKCSGARRVVGDSVCVLDDFDLCLIGHGIEHAWQQNECMSKNIREITIQFSSKLLGEELLKKNRMASIRTMLERSSKGIAFSKACIMDVYHYLIRLANSESPFEQMLDFLRVLHILSNDTEAVTLSSSAYSNASPASDSRRIQKVQGYVEQNYSKEIRLEQLAQLARMAPTSFSRFFKLRTGRSVQDYITDVRIGHATRQLMDGTETIAEICYECGFNNISNFNRIFKKKKNLTPREFRELYRRNQIII